MKVREWLVEAGVTQPLQEKMTMYFPQEMEASLDEAWVTEWAEGVDEFRFTLRDWTAALIALEEEMQKSPVPSFSIQRKIGYLHCAAMYGEMEVTQDLSDIVREMYEKYGMDEE